MTWIVAGVTAAATIYSANKASKAAKSAANTQAGSADRAAQVQWDMYNQSRADNEPWRAAGQAGLAEYMALLGMPPTAVSAASTPTQWYTDSGGVPIANASLYSSDPRYRSAWDQAVSEHKNQFGVGYTKDSGIDSVVGRVSQLYGQSAPAQQQSTATAGTSLTQQQAFDRFRNQPGYQFGLDQGVKALDSSATAAGGLFSGKAAKALTQFGQNYADQQGYTPYMNRLASLAGIGQTATAQNAQLGQQAAGNVGNALMSAGDARASGITNSANVWGSAGGQLAGLAGYAWGNRGPSTGASSPGWWGSGGWGGI